jgi:hypothetical protein
MDLWLTVFKLDMLSSRYLWRGVNVLAVLKSRLGLVSGCNDMRLMCRAMVI